MHLTHPKSELDFRPSPIFFLGPFDVYDREESLGAELDSYDPNSRSDQQRLFDQYVFPRWTALYGYTLSHRLALAKTLIYSLQDANYNFSALIEDSSEHFCLPSSWIIKDPREFFCSAYVALLRHWRTELQQAGHHLPEAKDLQGGS